MTRNQMMVVLSCMTLAACSSPVDEQAQAQAESPKADEVGSDSVTPDSAKKSCDNSAWIPSSDPGYRVQIYPKADNGGQHAMPSPTTNWTLKYEYTVPALPCSSTWNSSDETYYIWGDVDFDAYGSNGYDISSYAYNQIVPQLMIGRALSSNNSAYAPSWGTFTTWVIQAQYYWHNANGTDYAQTGKAVGVSPGDLVTTSIKYTASTGVIDVTISTSKVSSWISIPRPFPNESPALFSSWKDFFQQAAAKSSSTLYARPLMNVESHYVDEATVCAGLPWKVELFSEPGTVAKGTSFTVAPYSNLSCPGGKYATLSF